MKKEKQITSNAQLTALETALQAQFKPDASRLDSLIREAYERTAKMQGDNLAAMVGFGLLALSIKPLIGHSKFGEWLKTALDGQIGKSTAYKWIESAKFLIAKIATAQRQNDIIAERICEFISISGVKGGAEEIFADAKLSASFISEVAYNLPFSTFLNILKTANVNAIAVEEDEIVQKKLGGELPKRKVQNDDPAQSDFFDLLENDLISIDRKIRSSELTRLPKDKVIKYAEALIERGQMLKSAVTGK